MRLLQSYFSVDQFVCMLIIHVLFRCTCHLYLSVFTFALQNSVRKSESSVLVCVIYNGTVMPDDPDIDHRALLVCLILCIV